MKHLHRAACAVGAVLLLAGCSSAPTAGVAGLAGGPGSIKIQAGSDEIPALQQIAEEFTADTGVEVEFVQREINAQAISNFISQSPTGQAPDIIVSPHDNLGQLASNGVVVPVEMGDRAEDFTENAREAVVYDGVSYGVPYAIENVAMLRNNELAAQDPATFDELRAIGHRLMEERGIEYPFTVSQSPEAGDPYHLYALQTSFGAEVFERTAEGEYTGNLTMGGEDGNEFARYLQELGASGDLRTSMTPDIAKESFLNGESAFHLGGPWELTDVEAAGMDVSVLPVPPAGGEEARPFVGVQAFFVNANAQNPMAAQDFAANYLTRPEAQTAMYESTGRPPASQVAVDRMQGDPLRSAYAEIAETGLPMPAIPEMGAVWSFWGTTQNAVVDGRGDPVELWNRMIDNIEGQI
ncbi:maltose ABC transporter substrate-binding protein [Kocuria rosea]|uniref:sugar ABC transporter substrate-binding protein n=1 Tax=Kocuria rosea TaxID=1275 RepID=UPI000D65D094|nr:maltose ABC transporter substrate-binding protein [Kocuria rosea]PWF87303.1 maltose ABC transporter substrate-binding protein [Kocuria rosea]QCY34303.1 maltose ABC transporter substrate-binding protein [Kocuria rosea]TQN38552.1 carbohydrate ABC transporter substrate-binding protein (CUT1 family) [Kocuria rosea]